jgi:hypothetical protein
VLMTLAGLGRIAPVKGVERSFKRTPAAVLLAPPGGPEP